MKNAIITIALVLLACILVVCQLDINQMERQGVMVKNTCDQMADAAGISINLEEYSKGYIIFNYDTGVSLAKEVLMKSLGYSSTYKSENDYFKEDAKVHIYFFDQSGIAKYYFNGIWQRDFDFEFGQNISAYISGESFEIAKPCVYVKLDAGRPRIRLKFALGQGRICKTSVYEYVY